MHNLWFSDLWWQYCTRKSLFLGMHHNYGLGLFPMINTGRHLSGEESRTQLFWNYFLCMVLFSGIYFVLLCNHLNKSTGHILDIFHIMHLHLVFDSWNFVWKFSQDTFISIEIKYILVSLVELRRFTYCWFECCILTTHDKMISLSFLILLPQFNNTLHRLMVRAIA